MTWLATFGETMGLCTGRVYGPLRQGSALELGFGGAESNVAIGLRRLGIPTAWCGRLGDDDLGRLVVKGLKGEGIDVSAATIDPSRPTGLMIKFSPRSGRTSVIYYRKHAAAADLGPDDLALDTIAGAEFLHVTGISPALGPRPREAVAAAVAHARAEGTRVSLDLNYRSQLWGWDEAEPVLRTLIPQADILLLGRAELDLLNHRRPVEEAVGLLAESGPSQVVAKLGEDGAVASIDGRRYSAPGWPAPVVDPVGAGDGFAAGYLAAVHDRLDPQQRLEQGLAVASVAVGTHGDWEGMPRRAEVPDSRGTRPLVDR
ncbi:sugar kinase [Streptomonospora litoralis]|uniref:2-dehydro-3-deoxygluconokinase n=1 Tax=Streptomonospora litoralis TaxID=2498135 RepID=A0A4V0ZJC7_9ACTN|nr:sugar kinase [Streptomonospora litoralis]QBI53022.1 2-dehydro-3-deoxygluconokinase [Streptomonospora litoralis]